MARAVLSSMDEFTDIISRENFQWETKSEVQRICHELLATRKFLEDEHGWTADEEASRQEQYLRLLNTIFDAEDAIVNYVLGIAPCWRRMTSFTRYISSCCQDSGTHKNFREKISLIVKSIKELKDKLKESTSSHYRGGSSLKLSDWIRCSIDFEEEEDEYDSSVVGLSEDVECLREELFGNMARSVISVVGFQGIGKTRLAWEIYKRSILGFHFECRAWVCASAMDNDVEEIWEDICTQINEFRWDKRYLIVIDDVGDPQVWSALKQKIMKEDYEDGSRIILTTRDVGVASSADYSHRLKVLSKAESWELFRKKLFITPWRLEGGIINASGGRNEDTTITDLLPPELEALGKKMVEKCAGIPYLIVELANLLSTMNANIVEWSCVLHGTDTHLSHQDQHPWYNLASSVDEILPLHVKQFLHVFPTATEIPERRLTLSWAAEGGLLWQQRRSNNSKSFGCDEEEKEEKKEEEAAAETFLWMQDLQDLKLIKAAKVSSDGIAKTYCIPPDLPLVQILKRGGGPGGDARAHRSSPHDDGCSGGGRGGARALKSSSHDDGRSGGGGGGGKVWIHRIADDFKHTHSRRIQSNIGSSNDELKPYKSLRSVWCFNYPRGYNPVEDVGSLLKKCINTMKNQNLWFLRVLDLEGVYKPSLPDAIGKLINLRYLGLRWTFLDTLPSSVAKLKNLRTLDIKHTDIVCYPTIRNMVKLQHLYLNGWHPRRVVRELSHFRNLQTLSGLTLDDLKDIGSLEKLKKLRKLRLTCRWFNRHQKEAMVKWFGKLENLETLKLISKDLQGGGHQIQGLLLTNLTNKLLSRMYLRGQLKILEHQSSFGTKLTELTFSLTQLTVDPMPTLERLPKLKLLSLFSKSYTGVSMHCSRGMFKELRVLKIWKLEKLEDWTVEDGAMEKLKELDIRSCVKLKMLPVHVPMDLFELKLTDMPKEFTEKFKADKRVIIED